jgi:3D (Asp-Asp-Asp) domain-containing protein
MVCYGRRLVGRGTRSVGPLLGAVLGGLAAAAFLPATGSSTTEGAPAPGEARVYRLKVDAVAYHLPGRTAAGLPVRKGVVAVDPVLIPLGTRMHVPGYGKAIAADVGVAIKGRIIDLWMPNDAAARRWGRKTVTITVYPAAAPSDA